VPQRSRGVRRRRTVEEHAASEDNMADEHALEGATPQQHDNIGGISSIVMSEMMERALFRDVVRKAAREAVLRNA
jgi:hypothetical protein